jgi:hypothetical protein
MPVASFLHMDETEGILGNYFIPDFGRDGVGLPYACKTVSYAISFK